MNISKRSWLLATESSIHKSRMPAITVLGRVAYADTSKKEVTWYGALGDYISRIRFNPESIRWMVYLDGAPYNFGNSDGNLYVRYLYWNGDKWIENYNWLDNDWNSNNPAAVLATCFISLPLCC